MQKVKVIAKTTPDAPGQKGRRGLVHRVRTAGPRREISRRPRGGGRGMTGGIRNPAKLPADLNPAEEYFARCLVEGQPCVIGNGKLPGPEGRIESGEGVNVVRGEIIRFFAYGGNEDNYVSGLIIHLQGGVDFGGFDC